jgi:exoribonuclease R
MNPLPGITIDSPGSQDLDDAVWAVREGEQIRLWICIADVAHSVAPQSVPMQQALLWLESRYRDERLVRSMLPPRLTQTYSLLPQVPRPVVALELLLAPDGSIQQRHFQRQMLFSQGRLSYDAVDQILAGQAESPFQDLLQCLAQAASWLDRGRQGVWGHAIGGEFRDDTGQVQVGSRQLIASTAIAYNALVGNLLAEAKLPALYRVQDITGVEEFTDLIEQWGHQAELLAPFISHRLPRAEHRSRAGSHWALRLPAYARTTSPLRRVEDLVNQQQLLAILKGDRLLSPGKAHHPPWSESLLQGLCERLQDRAIALEAVQRERTIQRRQQQLNEAVTLTDITANQLTSLLERSDVEGEQTAALEELIERWLESERLTPRHAAVILTRPFSPALRQKLVKTVAASQHPTLNAISILTVLEQMGVGAVSYTYQDHEAGWSCRVQWQTFEAVVVAGSKSAARAAAALRILEALDRQGER